MKRETLYLSFYYVDKFLSLESNVKNDEFQLLGLTAMYAACKMEEVYPIQTSDFLLSADNLYSTEQIVNMELILYKKLDFHLTPTTAQTWLLWYMSQWDAYLPPESAPSLRFK
jgi:hypothetical protein